MINKENWKENYTHISNEVIDNEKVLRVVKSGKINEYDENTYAKLVDSSFHNGIIEVKMLSRLLKEAPDFARGFIGIAYRINEDDTKFESFYVRPTNGRQCDDSVRKQHGCQYFSYPTYTFAYFREHGITKYENQVDIDLNEWISLKAVIEDEKATFYLNDEKHPLKAGELMIINSNEVHSIDSPEENHTAVLQIPLKQFEDYFTAHRFIRFAANEQETDSQLWRLIREMYKLYGKRGTGYEFKIRSFYYDVLYLLVNHYRLDEAGEQEVRHSRRLDALARITSYMREHYQEELKLTEVANMFGYSDAYLSRMFQKYANVNFKTYLQDIRMTYAYRELLNSDKTISQIAMDNGFSSSRAFTREFQKRYGILPSEVEREK